MSRQFLTPIAPLRAASDPIGTYAGEIYFNTAIGMLKFFNGTSWTPLQAGGAGASNKIEVLDEAPASPSTGSIYFDATEYTIKFFNGNIWYDVAGPRELLDHNHNSTDGYVKNAIYGKYVADEEYVVSMDGGTANIDYSIAPNDDIINAGGA